MVLITKGMMENSSNTHTHTYLYIYIPGYQNYFQKLVFVYIYVIYVFYKYIFNTINFTFSLFHI